MAMFKDFDVSDVLNDFDLFVPMNDNLLNFEQMRKMFLKGLNL